jgi:hypothetical protein
MRIGTGGYQLLIDDGTGRISAVAWESDGPQVLPKINPESIYNKYVSVRGTLVGFRAEIQIRIESVDIISDEPTEEQLWWLDVKEEWENLAAKSRAEISPSDNPYCPCLCHAGTGNTCCKTLGNRPPSWPPEFNKAVAVIKSTLRSIAANRDFKASISEIVRMLRDNQRDSPTLAIIDCLPDCAGVEAVRELIESQCAVAGDEITLLSKPMPEDRAPDQKLFKVPRYPMTPEETYLTQIPKSQDQVRVLDLRIRKNPS